MPVTSLTATSGGNKPADFEDCRCLLGFKEITDVDPTGKELEGQYGKQFRWTFIVRNQKTGEMFHDDRGFEWFFNPLTSQKMGKGGAQPAKARVFIEALLGRELQPNEKIKIEELDDRWMSAVLTENEKGYVDISDGSIKPYEVEAKKKGQASTAKANNDEDDD